MTIEREPRFFGAIEPTAAQALLILREGKPMPEKEGKVIGINRKKLTDILASARQDTYRLELDTVEHIHCDRGNQRISYLYADPRYSSNLVEVATPIHARRSLEQIAGYTLEEVQGMRNWVFSTELKRATSQMDGPNP